MQAHERLTLAIDSLNQSQIVMPRMVAESILAHVCGVRRQELDGYGELNDDEMMRFENLLSRVKKGEPFEYVIGRLEFYGNDILISRFAHIPSPETELMLDFAVKKLKENGIESGVAVDVCCGSGCIGLGMKRQMEHFDVVLTDIDEDCVSLARDNAARLDLDVRVLQGDFLVPARAIGADVFFCNPPYISEDEYQTLDKSVTDYEPKKALVAQDEGLYFYKKLAEGLKECLNDKAMAFIEIGSSQGKQVESLFKKSGLKIVSLEKDLAGHDRFFFLVNE